MTLIKLVSKLTLLLIAVIAVGVLSQRAQLSVLALSRIDPVPETRQLVDQERYAEAADYLVPERKPRSIQRRPLIVIPAR